MPSRRRAGAAKPQVVIAGVGRVGGALALGLSRGGWPVSVVAHSPSSRRAARRLGLELATDEALGRAGVCLLAVPDQAVAQAAARLSPRLGQDCALIHCAGALPLSTLSAPAQGRPRGSFHPLCAISDARDALAGHAVALAATKPQLARMLRRMALDLGLLPIRVTDSRRAAYHAGAVMSAGLLVALLSSGVEALVSAGVGRAEALRALLALMRSALRGVEQRGLARGLTGPVVRGDLAVVAAHLAALTPHLRAPYRQLSLRALALARGRVPRETAGRLERLLTSR